MEERNPIQWPEKFGSGIRSRILGLNFCIEKLDKKIAYLVRVTEAYEEDTPFSTSTIELFTLKMEVEDVKKGINEILIQYRDACDKNKEKEEEDKVMEELKDFIIEVYKIKRNIDQKITGLDVPEHIVNEGESSQDLTAKKGGDGEDDDPKGKGLMIDDSADDDVMKSRERGESSEARSFTELIKDGILTLSSSSSEEEILTDEVEKKDEDIRERFLKTVAEAFSLSESESESENENDVVEQQSSDSGPEDVAGGVQELEQDLMEMIIESGSSSGSSSQHNKEEAIIF